ncbi:MAG TPA: mannitol dehydrogenase family protein [Acidimicrobiales bacterium]|nr:mannitol dehydrogenase family protein [Acidimicrobiales bacterium]
MTLPPLARTGGYARRAGPVRLVHLGLGNFFRAHQAWYTERATDAGSWGYAAFGGRGAELARALDAQDGLYTLLTRSPTGDTAEVIASISEARAGADHDAWLAAVASPHTSVVTVTVTEAGYCRGPGGGLDLTRPDVAADLAGLQAVGGPPPLTAPGRLVAGMAARRRSEGGPLALVPCDNVPGNGDLARRVVTDLAGLVDPALAAWIDASMKVVSTVVDRITPRAAGPEASVAAELTGRRDRAPVVTEPFSEWILAGEFPAGRPRWEDTGAVFTDDVTVYEHRKLWLLNGAHSLLAYAGSILGHRTVAEAIGDDLCREWVRQWWAAAAGHLGQPEAGIAAYEEALLRRFANGRMHDELSRIAEDGSQKLPIRVLPVLGEARAAGEAPAAATRILAAWLCHLRGRGAPVRDVRADELTPLASGALPDAARRILAALDPGLGADDTVVAMVADQCRQLEADGPR